MTIMITMTMMMMIVDDDDEDDDPDDDDDDDDDHDHDDDDDDNDDDDRTMKNHKLQIYARHRSRSENHIIDKKKRSSSPSEENSELRESSELR